MNLRGLLAYLDVRAAVAWWFRDAEAPPDRPVMVPTRIGTRPGHEITICTLLEAPPRRGRVIFHAVLPPGADRHRVGGVLLVMCREARRWAPEADWSCYVTDGTLVGYCHRDSRHPLVAAIADAPRRPIRALPGVPPA